MGMVYDHEEETKCPHCKKKLKLLVQTNGEGSITYIGLGD